MRITTLFLSVIFITAFAAIGCEDKGGDSKAASGGGGGGGGEIGVAECDEYVKKYTACLSDKVSAEAKDAMQKGMDTMVSTWKEAAKTPEGKKGLAQGCKAALDGAKQAMGAYGCEW